MSIQRTKNPGGITVTSSWLRLFLAKNLAKLTANGPLLEMQLRRSLAWKGFCLPVSFATEAMGESLFLNVSPKDLPVSMCDWVLLDKKRLRISEYFVGEGDWSKVASSDYTDKQIKELKELIDNPRAFRDTEAYRLAHEKMLRKQPLDSNGVSLDKPSLIDAYFERNAFLVESIKRHGILRLSEVLKQGAACPGSPARNWGADRTEKDISVAVDSAGGLVRLPGGYHRFAIARLLNLPSIPVQVRLVHREWLRKRCSEAGGGKITGVLVNAIAEFRRK